MRGRETAETIDATGIEASDAADEDIVVDENSIQAALSSTMNMTSGKSESSSAVMEKLMSIEQAILSSIEKCRKIVEILFYC